MRLWLMFNMEITQPLAVKKVWGREEIIVNNEKYCGKILVLNRGYRCSIHRHPKDETFYVQSGEVYLELENNQGSMESAILLPTSVVHISPSRWHRFSGLENSVIFEFSTPDTESERSVPSEAIPDFENWIKKINRDI